MYRADLAKAAVPRMPSNPHSFIGTIDPPEALAVMLAAQSQMAAFLNGSDIVLDVNEPLRPLFGGKAVFEAPSLLLEQLNYFR